MATFLASTLKGSVQGINVFLANIHTELVTSCSVFFVSGRESAKIAKSCNRNSDGNKCVERQENSASQQESGMT